jgi:hypothetical protein
MKLFDCDECGSTIDPSEDYEEIEVHSLDPVERARILRIHAYSVCDLSCDAPQDRRLKQFK